MAKLKATEKKVKAKPVEEAKPLPKKPDEKEAVVSPVTRDDSDRHDKADAAETSEEKPQPEDADDDDLGFGEGIL